MLRLQPSEIALTASDVASYKRNVELKKVITGQSSPSNHFAGMMRQPTIRRGPQRSRDEAITHPSVRQLISHSTASSESDEIYSASADNFNLPHRVDNGDEPSDESNVEVSTSTSEHSDHLNSLLEVQLSLEDEQQSAHDLTQILKQHGAKPADYSDRFFWKSLGTRRDSELDSASKCTKITASNCRRRQRSWSDTLNSPTSPVMSGFDDVSSSRSNDFEDMRRRISVSTAHSRHSSLPTLPSSHNASRKRPLVGQDLIECDYQQRSTSPPLAILEVIRGSHSPLEELTQAMAMASTPSGSKSTLTKEEPESEGHPPSDLLDWSPMIPQLMHSPTTQFLNPSPNPRRRLDADTFDYDDEVAASPGVVSHDSAVPGQGPNQRYRSRNSVWHSEGNHGTEFAVARGGRPTRSEPIRRAPVEHVRRFAHSSEQENVDELGRFLEERRLWRLRQQAATAAATQAAVTGGDVLLSTPPAEGRLERYLR